MTSRRRSSRTTMAWPSARSCSVSAPSASKKGRSRPSSVTTCSERRIPTLAPVNQHLAARGRPGEPGQRQPAAGELAHVAAAVDDGDAPAVVAADGVIHEGHLVAVGRDADVAHIAAGLVEHAARRELQPALPAHVAHDGQRGAVGSEVGVLHALQELAGRAAADGRAGQRAHAHEAAQVPRPEQQRQLAPSRDGQQVRGPQPQRARLGAVRAGHVDLAGTSVPPGAVHDAAAARREARAGHDAAPEGQAAEGGQRAGAGPVGPATTPPPDRQQRQPRQHGAEPGGAPGRAGAAVAPPLAERRLQVEGEVARRLEALAPGPSPGSAARSASAGGRSGARGAGRGGSSRRIAVIVSTLELAAEGARGRSSIS